MNNSHLIKNDEPTQAIDEKRLLEESFDPINMDDAFLINFIDSQAEGKIERRRHKRFKVNKYAFALIRSATATSIKIQGRSMGEIACSVFRSKPDKLGRINNISLGGFMFRHVDSKAQLNELHVLDILSADCGFYLEDLRFKSVSDFAVPEEFPGNPIKMRQFHLEFGRLSNAQTDKLEYFIEEVLSRPNKFIDIS